MRNLLVLFLIAALASTASALTLDMVYLTGETDQPADTVTNQLVFDTESVDWLSAQIVVQPSATGKIYIDSMGNAPQSPNPAWFGMVPSLQYDSFVTDGGALGGSVSTQTPVNLDGTEKIWTTDEIAMGWYTDNTDDIGTDLMLAQVTLDDDTTGTWKLKATCEPAETGPVIWVLGGTIVDGEMIIPEPMTMGLLAVGGFGLLIRRKR